MKITERLMLPGDFAGELDQAAPRYIWQAVADAVATYDSSTDRLDPTMSGQIVVFDNRTTTPSLATARWAGQLQDCPIGDRGFAGEGLAAYIGRSNGYGPRPSSAVSYAAQDLSAWFDDLLPSNGVTKGTVTTTGLSSVEGMWSPAQTVREMLTWVCGRVGNAEWRINPDGSIDAAAEGDLFDSGLVIVHPDPQPVGSFPFELAGRATGLQVSAASTASDAIIAADGAGAGVVLGSASAGTTIGYALDGAAGEFVLLVNAPTVAGADASTVAASALGPRKYATSTWKVLVTDPVARRRIAPGDTIYVYDPERGIDGGSPISVGGRVVRPQLARVRSLVWETTPANGVWLRTNTGTESWLDLSDWIIHTNTPTSVLTVGSGRGETLDSVASSGQSSWLGDGPAVADRTSDQTDWTTVTSFATGWDSWYANGVGYRKRGDVVEVRGLAKRTGATTTADSTIFTLPTGYRPAARPFIAITTSGAVAREVRVNTDGTVVAFYAATPGGVTSGAYFSLDPIRFSIN